MDTLLKPSLGQAAIPARQGEVLRTRAEVAALLVQLRDQTVPITLTGAQGQRASCTLWSVDAANGRVRFSMDEHSSGLESLVQQGTALATTWLDGIQVDFDIAGLVLVHSADSCHLQAALPHYMQRHQRRESYRVRYVSHNGPIVHINDASAPGTSLAMRVLDISIGGCCLLAPGKMRGAEVGFRFGKVRVDLLPGTRFTADICVNSVLSAPYDSYRLGCEWQSMDGTAQRILQRFVDDAQRRSRLSRAA